MMRSSSARAASGSVVATSPARRSPISVAEIETAVASPPERIENLVSSLVLLAGKGAIQPTQPPETVAHCTAACRRLNDTLIRFQRGAREAQSLASPVTGIGMPVRYTDQLFVQATWAGHTSEPELARHAADAMVAHGRVLTVAGRTMQTRDEILPEMAVQARQFLDVRLASLRRLGIV